MSRAASQYTSGTLNPLMSMPMICAAAWRASSGDFASLMPPALPRPPTGTWAFTATGPSSAQASAACSGVRATLPDGMGMPSAASTSLAWYSRSFTTRRACVCGELVSRGGRSEGANLVGAAVRPTVAETSLKVGVADESEHSHDAQDDDDEQGDAAADQDCGPGRLCPTRRRRVRHPGGGLSSEGTPGGAIPVAQPVVRDPATLSIL